MNRTAELVDEVRRGAPLVHCLTATVSMELVANLLLAAGARPTMTWTREEAPHVVRRADALLVNLGTLSEQGRAGMLATVPVAVELGLPWVLDPAAVGPAPSRVALAHELLAMGPAVVRCNASEALVLAGSGRGGRGADAVEEPGEALQAAGELARRHGCVVAVSGAVDVITDGSQVVQVPNGSPMMAQVTGVGCALGGLTAACCAALLSQDRRPAAPAGASKQSGPGWALEAAVAAATWLGVAGERAASAARGPGSFAVALLDEVAGLIAAQIAEEAR